MRGELAMELEVVQKVLYPVLHKWNTSIPLSVLDDFGVF